MLSFLIYIGANVEILPVESRKRRKQNQRLFIKGLPTDAKEQDLLDYFNKNVGKVCLQIFPKDKNTGLLRNFCYLEFEDEELVSFCCLFHVLDQ